MGQPYFKKSHKCYYANINGKPVRLEKTESEAYARYAKIINPAAPAPAETLAPAPAPVAGPTLADLVKKFCAHVEANSPKGTVQSYTRYAKRWATFHGHLSAASIIGAHITEAADALYPKVNKNPEVNGGKPYSDTVRWQHAKVCKQIFAFAKSEGYIAVNPIEGYRSKVKCGKREVDLSREDFERLLAACDDPAFRDVLIVLWDTGCRPKEAFDATARHLDREKRCIRYAKGKGGKPRVVFLTDRAFEIMARSDGVLLRNRIGQKWTIGTASKRLKVLEARTGVVVTCYAFRHAFCTRHVKAGTNLVKLQHLMGHSSLKMISEVYAHVGGDSADLRSALSAA